MNTDPISDFLTRIRNAQAARHDALIAPGSRIKLQIAKILSAAGFIGNVEEKKEGAKRTIHVTLKYMGKVPAIRSISRVSTPGRRVYRKSDELPIVLSHQGIAIVSTSSGLMTNKEAHKRKLGGEILCEVY